MKNGSGDVSSIITREISSGVGCDLLRKYFGKKGWVDKVVY